MTIKREGLAREPPASPALLADPVQFEAFYRQYFLRLVRRATWKYHLEKEDARDVVQEAFVVALAKLDPKRNPKAWLIQVVDNLSANFQRKMARRSKLVSKWSPSETARASEARLGEDLCDGGEELGDQGG